ncbi:MAG: hypothetical protein H7644_12980 [Candidatus Heimdallarchaeota archaeon]|nr:hypothetical protein [Candidatus Heimdallarchaeota archaeon]MCK5144673.1 hypothetical protein [Candidatus Heimdallarchaeota archaeon]
MNENNESRILIDAFKAEVKKKLPIWLKAKEDELKDFLDELEDHIWDKSSELAEGGDPQVMHVREAIILMGNPRKIAKEFRTRGTPKFFVTEELWPWYYRSLIFSGIVSILVTMITMAFKLGKGDPAGLIVGDAFWEMFVGFAFAFAAITLLFVQLSYHGFLPEDFKRMAEEEIKPHAKKPKKKRPKKPKAVLPTSGGYLFEGIVGLVIGGVLIFYPFVKINEPFMTNFMVGFPELLKLVGGVLVIGGIIKFSQALIGKRLRLQQMFLALHIIPTSLNLALFLRLHFNPNLIQVALQNRFVDANIPLIVKAIVIVGAVLSIIGMIGELVKIAKLEIYGFTYTEKSYRKLIELG